MQHRNAQLQSPVIASDRDWLQNLRLDEYRKRMIKDAPEADPLPPFTPSPPNSQLQPLLSQQQRHGYTNLNTTGYASPADPQSSRSSRSTSPGNHGAMLPNHIMQAAPMVLVSGARHKHHPLAGVRAKRRFCHTIIVAFIAWFALAWLLRAVNRAFWWTDGVVDIPADMTVQDCLFEWRVRESSASSSQGVEGLSVWEDFPFRAAVAYDLPLNSDMLFLISRGFLTKGTVKVGTSSKQPADKVTVGVVMGYRDIKIRNMAKICRVKRGRRENGVGIFTPRKWGWFGRTDELEFETVVTFPTTRSQGAKDGRTTIHRFETDLVNTKQILGDLGSELEFTSLDLRSSNAHIEAKTVTGRDIQVRSTNGRIRGSFSATRALSLETSNGAVDVDLGLTSDRDVLFIGNVTSSNGAIRARVNLISSDASGTGGNFKLSTTTSNGSLDISFPSAPLDSRLDYEARTSNAYALVAMDPVYEGSFSVETSNALATVTEDPYIRDPSGRGRRWMRSGWVPSGKEKVTGKVEWEGSGRGDEGNIYVHTSNGQATLVVVDQK